MPAKAGTHCLDAGDSCRLLNRIIALKDQCRPPDPGRRITAVRPILSILCIPFSSSWVTLPRLVAALWSAG